MYGRFNKITVPLVNYEINPDQKVFNADRKNSVLVKDSLIDPHQTILPCRDPLGKDPGYLELGKRSTVMHDLKSRVIKDYQGRIIIKIDESHGLKNASILQ